MSEKFSDAIKKCRMGAAANPFQGSDKKVLFLCHMGILRSATAARLYGKKYNTRAAGLWADALIPATPLLCQWADEVVCVTKEVHEELMARHDLTMELENTPVKVLDIPDQFEHMSPALVNEFEQQYEVIP